MKKFFTLMAAVAMAVCAGAQDLTGDYLAPFSWQNGFGDPNDKVAVVSVETIDETHVAVYNLCNLECTVTGEVDAAAGTITFTDQQLNGYTFCTEATLEAKVIATIKDGVISFSGAGTCAPKEGSDELDWWHKALSCTMTKIVAQTSVPASYVLNEGKHLAGNTTMNFYDSSVYDFDYGFKVGKTLFLFYKDGENLDQFNANNGDVNPNETDANSLDLTTLEEEGYWDDDWNWVPTKKEQVWKLEGDKTSGRLTMQGEYCVGGGFFADTVDKGTFTVAWGDMNGVSNVKAASRTKAIYNLLGQRVNGNAKGIVIVDGKKAIRL